MKRVLLFLITTNTALLYASTGVAFLKIPVDARVCGIGEAAVAYVDNASALYYNPAGLAYIESFDLLFMHNDWLLDMSHEYVAAGFGSKSIGTFGLSFNYWGSGEIQGITIRGDTIPGYYFSASDWCLNLGYGKEFSKLALGVGFKFISEKNESLSTSAYACDIGGMYNLPITGLKTGLSVTNLGTKLKLDQENYSLPISFRVGWRYDHQVFGITQDFIFSNTEKFGIALGAEYRVREILSLRLGYRTGSNTEGFSNLRAGLGVLFKGFGIDYAFAPYGKLGMTHRISISFRNRYSTLDE
ncbi:MAG: PorV/PorQ family protein [candidate division WOR-3 bacterium]|nr:PorV/PorQ family protein [candidate division WOR-3 bacterium]